MRNDISPERRLKIALAKAAFTLALVAFFVAMMAASGRSQSSMEVRVAERATVSGVPESMPSTPMASALTPYGRDSLVKALKGEYVLDSVTMAIARQPFEPTTSKWARYRPRVNITIVYAPPGCDYAVGHITPQNNKPEMYALFSTFNAEPMWEQARLQFTGIIHPGYHWFWYASALEDRRYCLLALYRNESALRERLSLLCR